MCTWSDEAITHVNINFQNSADKLHYVYALPLFLLLLYARWIILYPLVRYRRPTFVSLIDAVNQNNACSFSNSHFTVENECSNRATINKRRGVTNTPHSDGDGPTGTQFWWQPPSIHVCRSVGQKHSKPERMKVILREKEKRTIMAVSGKTSLWRKNICGYKFLC